MMKMTASLVIVGLLLMGCKDAAGGPVTTTVAPASAPASGGEIGVAECDDWIRKVEACGDKDARIKVTYAPGLKMMRESWKEQYAAGGASKAMLKTSCQTSLDTLDKKCK